ncbi:uncharacterized protein VP01_1059g3 [Puccinia sorghi]|uniref:Uncharacterized protein n=1 Tax=Puccinia sorghi TaxID=27349 RepID=A0A0L6VTZ0_9BASI|nr:uncharacterized protein VP01_1059g3 [Puccinia sorghi]
MPPPLNSIQHSFGPNQKSVLIDELKSDDVLACLTSIHRLTTIALALGPERTRDELIPFNTKGMDDEDEVLLALAGELNAAFVEFLGGPDTVEDMLICNKAAKSLTQIAVLLSAQQLSEYYLPAMKRLSVAEWRMYSALCANKTPMVRRAAAKELGVTQSRPLAKVLSQSHLVTALIPVFHKLAADDQDLVRLLTVDALQQLGSTIKAMVSNQSWRVSAGEDVLREELVPAFVCQKGDVTFTRSPPSILCKLIEREVILSRVLIC